MPRMDALQLLFLGGATLLAAFVMSLAGFGYGLVSMGLYPFLVSIVDANVLASLLALPVIILNLTPLVRHLRWKLLLPIILGTAAGTPLGVWGLIRLPERILLFGLGAVILVALVLTEVRKKAADRAPHVPAALGVGLVGGAFGGAYSVSGPPVTLYLTSLLDDKREIKAHLLGYFLVQILYRLIFLAIGGAVSVDHIKTAVFLVVPLALGISAGMFLFWKIPSSKVRRITQAILAVSGIMLMIKALWS